MRVVCAWRGRWRVQSSSFFASVCCFPRSLTRRFPPTIMRPVRTHFSATALQASTRWKEATVFTFDVRLYANVDTMAPWLS